MAPTYYPVFLNLAERRCVVIGGGSIAEGKVKGLLETEAYVIVISPELTPELKKLAAEEKILHIERGYEPGDVRGAFLAISATDNRAVNEQVWQEAEETGVLINTVDDTPHCNFIAGSIVRQGALTIAISTSGSAPALAVRLKEKMAREFGPEYAEFLELMEKLREPLAARYPDFVERRTRWYALVDSDILEHLRAGRVDLAQKRIKEITGL
jgi:precorrin-2 dehydrogenase / sirohydrochlorin ferrochelatase